MNDSLEIPVDRIPLNPPKPSKTAVKEPEPAKPEAAPTPPPPQHWVGEAMRDLLTWNSKKTVIGSAVVSLALGAMTINAIMNRTPPPPQEPRLQTIPTTKTEPPTAAPEPLVTIPTIEPRTDPVTGFRPVPVEPIPSPTMPGVITAPLVAPTITEGPSTLVVAPIPQPSVVSTPPLSASGLILPTAATEPVQTPSGAPAAPGKIEVLPLPGTLPAAPTSGPAAPIGIPTPTLPTPAPVLPAPTDTPKPKSDPVIPAPATVPSEPITLPRIEPLPLPDTLPKPAPIGETPPLPKPAPIGEIPTRAPAAFTLSKQPGETYIQPNVGGETLQPRTGFDVDLHEVKTGDSFPTISKLHYGDAKYADALRAFNKNNELNRLRDVEIPPMYVLRQKYSQYVGAMRPAPEPTRISGGGVEWAGTGTSEKTYTVPRDGMTLREVAAEVYGSPKEWEKIWNENLRVNPDEKLPVGRIIKLPK